MWNSSAFVQLHRSPVTMGPPDCARLSSAAPPGTSLPWRRAPQEYRSTGITGNSLWPATIIESLASAPGLPRRR